MQASSTDKLKRLSRMSPNYLGLTLVSNTRCQSSNLGGPDGSVRIHYTENSTERFILRIPLKTRCDMEQNVEEPAVPVFALAFNPNEDKDDELVSTTLNG